MVFIYVFLFVVFLLKIRLYVIIICNNSCLIIVISNKFTIMIKPKIGHKGIGWVGRQVMEFLIEGLGYKVGEDYFPFDIDKGKEFNYDYNLGDWIIISVPSPRKADGSCDTSIVEESLKDIKDGKVVIIKSTVIPGTCEKLQHQHPNKLILFNPEFLTESQAKKDFFYPDRQIVGYTNKSRSVASLVLALLPDAFFTSPGMNSCYEWTNVNATEAEIGKYACNMFGSLKVVFANILADVCESLQQNFTKNNIKANVDYEKVRLVMGHDKRIKDSWLNIKQGNYRGFGGYCFPKDLEAFIKFMEWLVAHSENQDLTKCLQEGMALLRAAWNYNNALLARQGLTVEEVSRHTDQITSKR